GRTGLEPVPFVLGREAVALAQLVDLVGCQERRVILWPTSDREAVALDRVRKDHGRARRVGAALAERRKHLAEVVAAEILDERPDLTVVRGEQAREPIPLSGLDRIEHGLDDHFLARAEQTLVDLVGHPVDRGPEQLAVVAPERGPKAAAVLDL